VVTATCGVGTTDCTTNIDVTDAATSWYIRSIGTWKPNLGFMVKEQTEGSGYLEAMYYRGNNATASNRPKLTITYEVPGFAINFDPALGANYSPSTMLAGTTTHLPITVTNSGSYDFDTTNYQLAYWWGDGAGNQVSSGFQALTSAINAGTTSGTISLAVTPPAAPGQYTSTST